MLINIQIICRNQERYVSHAHYIWKYCFVSLYKWNIYHAENFEVNNDLVVLNAYELHMNSANLFALWFSCLAILTYSLRSTHFNEMVLVEIHAYTHEQSRKGICGKFTCLRFLFLNSEWTMTGTETATTNLITKSIFKNLFPSEHNRILNSNILNSDTFCAISRLIRYKF